MLSIISKFIEGKDINHNVVIQVCNFYTPSELQQKNEGNALCALSEFEFDISRINHYQFVGSRQISEYLTTWTI